VKHQDRCYLVIWAFQVKPQAQFAFEKIYGPDGDWSQLFRKSPDYVGTQLFRDLSQPGRYLTFDYWTTPEALHEFKQTNRNSYDALDQRCEALNEDEVSLGEFESSLFVGVP